MLINRARIYCYALSAIMAAVSLSQATAAYQLVFDGEDSAFRVKSGGWELDKTGSYQGNYRFSCAGPGTGSSVAAWDIDGIPDGAYNVEFYVDNGDYAAAAEYVIQHDSGTSTVTRSQNFVGSGWHNVGTFTFTGAGRIIQTDKWAGAGSKVIADALRITLQGEPGAPSPDSVPPEVSIVIDDLGALNPVQPGNFTYTLFTQAPQCTYAIIPFTPWDTQVQDDANVKGIETILHQPLEYIGQTSNPATDIHRLYTSLSNTTNINRLNENLNVFSPHIWGVNNHQGSRFSQYRAGMEAVIDDLQSKNFFFLDSRTISDSVSYDISREKGILCAERDLFVDGPAPTSSGTWTSKELVEQVGQQAIYAPNYNYVMICHQRNETVSGLLQALDTLETSGIEVKRLEHNLHYIVETDHIPPGASVNYDGDWVNMDRDMISHECFDGAAKETSNAAATATFTPNLPKAGLYRVFGAIPGTLNGALTRFTIDSNAPNQEKVIDPSINRNRWAYLGTFPFNAGTGANVTVRHAQPDQAPDLKVHADAVKFVYDGEMPADVDEWRSYQVSDN